MRTITLLLLLCFFIPTSCKKETTKSGKVIEIYLLKSYIRETNGSISNNSLVLEDSAVVKYEDILWYDSDTHIFKVSSKTANWLNDSQIHGKAFAIAINKEIIYTGYFWASFSSSFCNWVVIDPLNYGNNELSVELGYPGLVQGIIIPDNRNDNRLLEILRLDNKLK